MKRLSTILFIFLCLVGCQKDKYFPKDIEQVEVQIDRFDNALLQMDTTDWDGAIAQLYEQYPVFMPIFVDEMLEAEREELPELLGAFLSDTLYKFQQTNALEQQTMADIHEIQHELNTAFSRLHYLYPEQETPTITFFVSGFNAKILYLPNGIGVGADLYLGSDYEMYNMVVYNYQKQTMRKECIPADIIAAYLYQNVPYTCKKSRLIDQMIYQGKLYFLMSQLLPNEPNYEIMGYSKEQWEWCERNEKQVWRLMMDRQVLYSSERMELTSYLNDGPFTADIGQAAPSRLGIWLGWRIVESYMNNQKNTTLLELLSNGDTQQILEDSYYGI